ncbi:MAG: Ig-like domain-containing protein [Oscillospiraceae bacterium]|nr:Ig-like domain-containing protein [Oscillospiraceae bacterium]
MKLPATVAPANAGNKTLTWFSNNESVLTVDANGKVTAKGAGKATITAKSANGKIATCVITVVDPSSYKVEFTSQSVKMTVGSTMALEYKALPDGIIPEFEVIDEDIVSMDKNGNVTALKAGNAVIEARVGKGEWTWIYVFVQPTSDEKEAARKKFAEDVLYYVNIERAKEGLAPLQLMDELSYLAQIRTDEQTAVRTISHTRPDGTDYVTVFEESPTKILKKASCENLVQSAGYTAEGCVKAWMASKGHRANILRSNMTHMGIGVEFTNGTYQGSYIVTQLFIQYNG